MGNRYRPFPEGTWFRSDDPFTNIMKKLILSLNLLFKFYSLSSLLFIVSVRYISKLLAWVINNFRYCLLNLLLKKIKCNYIVFNYIQKLFAMNYWHLSGNSLINMDTVMFWCKKGLRLVYIRRKFAPLKHSAAVEYGNNQLVQS